MSEIRLLASALLLSGGMAAAVAAATLRYGVEAPPRIAGVRLAELTAAYSTRAASQGRSAEEVRAWGEALEAALNRVAKRHGAVLLPARAVAAGAPDLTRQVEATLAEFLARRTGGSAGAAPGDGR
ncbi:MAG: TrbI F-type domain-containing protein [Rhodospirillaceae bacterium]|nr:TrbI F-type domain-containing protein [Rhodospirillaceae bacterium]MDE0379673.1 TrbI F-type domain-containing protein [Rhodospirillales bacterium]